MHVFLVSIEDHNPISFHQIQTAHKQIVEKQKEEEEEEEEEEEKKKEQKKKK